MKPLLEKTLMRSVTTTQLNNLVHYYSYQHACEQLSGITPSDYFFAKEMLSCILQACTVYEHETLKQKTLMTGDEQQQLFHLLLVLNESLRGGHSCLPVKEVSAKRYFISEIEADKQQGFVFASFEMLCQLLQALPLAALAEQPIVFDQNCLYLRRYYQFEQELKHDIIAKRNVCEFNDEKIKTIVHRLFNLDGLMGTSSVKSEIDWQAVAVANALNKRFSVIAGGPGTGKTYTVTKLLAAILMLEPSQQAKPNIALVAPTGKAAQRLSESIINAVKGFRGTIDDNVLDLMPEQAQTLHRLLGVIPEQVNFKHHQDNQLAVDILLIDEVSMVDLPMMARVFRALPEHTRVILLGDADQLPSVAVGSVLADLAPRPHQGYSQNNHDYLARVTGYLALPVSSIKENAAVDTQPAIELTTADSVTFLQKSRRFDGEGGIGRIANFVIQGQYQQSWQLLQECIALSSEQDTQLSLLKDELHIWLAPLVAQYYQPLFHCDDVKSAFALLAKFRILSATRQGPQGVENLNEQVTDILRAKGYIPFGQSLYAGQPIMVTENNYRLGVYNGDIGVIWPNEQGDLMAVFEGDGEELQWLTPSRLPKYETVYAMTIHKTQGSEFGHVAMVLPQKKDNRLLSRELLYTGITRAKQHLSIACNEEVWRNGVIRQVQRFSGLALN